MVAGVYVAVGAVVGSLVTFLLTRRSDRRPPQTEPAPPEEALPPEYEALLRDREKWLAASKRQLILAGKLWNELVRVRGEPFEGKLLDPEERAYGDGWMYHSALAIELAAKAVLIPANPRLLEKKRNRMHDLAWLVRRAGIPLDDAKKAALDRYTVWVRWTTKYPVGLTPKDHARVVLGDMSSIIPFGDNAFIFFTVGQLRAKARDLR